MIGAIQIMGNVQSAKDDDSRSDIFPKCTMIAMEKTSIAKKNTVMCTVLEKSIRKSPFISLLEYCSRNILIRIIPTALKNHDSNEIS